MTCVQKKVIHSIKEKIEILKKGHRKTYNKIMEVIA